MAKFEPITVIGIAMRMMPPTQTTPPTTLPPAVIGLQSPYPTVVIVTIAHQKPRTIVPKHSSCLASSKPFASR